MPPLTAKKLPKVGKKMKKSGKIGKKSGKNGKKEDKSGRKGKKREVSFTLPLLIDRAGYATAYVYLTSIPNFMVKRHFVFELRLFQYRRFTCFIVLRYRQKHFKNIKIGK